MRSTLAYSVIVLWLQLLGVFFSDAVAIEVADIQFTELDNRDGLSSTVVLDIAEDDKGYIWLATMNGLNRYSGYDIKQYHPSDNDPHALPSGFIQKLFVDSENTLWIGTHSGLTRYRPETDDFETFNDANSIIKSDVITTISEAINGDILFADLKFLYRYSKSLSRITIVTELFDEQSIIKVIHDEANKIWIGSNELGAKIFDKKTKTLHALDKVNPWGINLDIEALHDVEVIDGNYWLATNKGIFVLDANGTKLRQINHELPDSSTNSIVLSIEMVGNNVWIGTNTGLYIINDGSLDENENNIIHLSSNSADITGLSTVIVLGIVQDKTGAVWLASLEGAYKYHPNYTDVRFHPVYESDADDEEYATIWGIAENKDSEIFFASQQRGIGQLNKVTGELSYLKKTPTPPESATFWDLSIDDNGTYWVASSVGLLAYRKEGNELRLLHNFFEGEFVDYLHSDSSKIWLWLEFKGLYSIDKSAAISGETDANIQHHEINIASNVLLPIFTDSSNRVWLRDEHGVAIYSPKSEKVIKHLNVSTGISSPVYSVYETSDAFWLTTRSDGVIEFSKDTLQVKRKQIRDDRDGFIFSSIGLLNSIWYADAAGVHQVHLPSLREVSTVSNAQLAFNSLGESAVLATQEGDIFFGGNKGFNKISRDIAKNNTSVAVKSFAPELFEFSVFGEPKTRGATFSIDDELAGEEFLQKENITYKQTKLLDYFESRFSLSFGLLNPTYLHEVSYRYRLNGLDDVWVYIGQNRTAQFNNISFGNYVFEVQAREPGKEWSDSRSLTIKIDRPPWLHTVALVFYALILTIVLAFIIRQYQLRKSNQLSIRESEERLKLTLWSSGDELWDWDVYRGQVYRANTWGTLDFPQDDIRTTGAYDANIHPNDIGRVRDALRSHLEGKSDFYELAYRAKTFKNQWIWLLDRGKVVERDHNEQPVRMTGTLKNINHLKEAEEQLNLFKRSIENISEGVFITTTQFKFISVNNAYCSYTGETREQALASYLHFHLYPDAFTEEIKKTLRTKGNWSGEVESVRVNGERYEMELNVDAVHDEDGKISHFVGVFSDITSRKSTEKELLKLANVDPLTELPNRSFYQASHQNLVRKGSPHTLLCLDMDNFKKINDSLGHQTGDILIKQIAKRLQRITGKNATCYRLGGDEFSVLMEDNADIHTVTHYAQGLLDTLARPFIINKQEFVLGASLGIAFFPDDGNTPQEMLKNADTAMYFAKNNGGNSYQFFSGEMNQNAVRQLQIENLIRQGIKDDLFTVYYQPKVDIASGKLVSMEALVRFEHPQKGIVSPGQFIPLAEQTGQIIEIGEQVLRKACIDTKRWVSQGLFTGRVAVNISIKQFELPDLDDRINRILSEVGLSPLHLECEITEGTLMEDPENGLRMMGRLRERGIHLALDDFGTGYSSLAYLKRFPLNTLKIDKAFIDDIAKSSVDRHMAAAIINIAHNLGLKVVAEGVEEEEQLNILRRYDCEMLQGFLYSRPLNAERFEKLLTENQKLHNLLGHSNI
ncbi:EAL domain-containing protein [Alteromonas sp. 1_MG-2023]|uniref:EAL domain-containing protein n=1 Tax=Alteromonas sp. 1_MG-2023 TaxID=3062669 RepID=UPI0026E314CE|nr:EAL domain-containing protein [Alteromonas sp. 1_MG-2023]MDO6567077.1 EAL domain-containing protein [Alteromonas sp. 1_MG-2023]